MLNRAWIYNFFFVKFFSRKGTVLETCPHMTISAFQWYPTEINGHNFSGHNADFFLLPNTLLPVPAVSTADCSNLSRIQLTEFRTEHWFLTRDTATALNGKVGAGTLTSFKKHEQLLKCQNLFFFFLNSRWQYGSDIKQPLIWQLLCN